MKTLVGLMLGLLISAQAFAQVDFKSSVADTESFAYSSPSLLHGGGGTVPWPWGSEVPFPFMNVIGVWVGQATPQSPMFVLSVLRGSTSNELQVVQIDPVTCHPIAGGMGTEVARVISMQMKDTSGRDVFKLTLRTFAEGSIRPEIRTIPESMPGAYLVLSVFPGDVNGPAWNMPLRMITNHLAFKCSELH